MPLTLRGLGFRGLGLWGSCVIPVLKHSSIYSQHIDESQPCQSAGTASSPAVKPLSPKPRESIFLLILIGVLILASSIHVPSKRRCSSCKSKPCG